MYQNLTFKFEKMSRAMITKIEVGVFLLLVARALLLASKQEDQLVT